MTKAPTPAEMSKGQSDYTYNATKNFNYTAVADGLRMVSWSNYGHPTGMVNWFTVRPSHSPQQPCNKKDTHLKICKGKITTHIVSMFYVYSHEKMPFFNLS